MSAIDLTPRHTPHLNGLSAIERLMLIEHLPGPLPAAPDDEILKALNKRQLLRFTRPFKSRHSMLTDEGWHAALACAAFEADRLTELENAK